MFIVVSTGLILAAALGYNYVSVKALLWRNVEDNVREVVENTVIKVDERLKDVADITMELASLVSEEPPAAPEIERMLKRFVQVNPEVFGSSLAFEPYAFRPDVELYMPYVHRSAPREINFQILGGSSYRYPELDWYREPRQQEQAMWSEPYFDKGGGNIVMATYSAPFFRGTGEEKRLWGIATADISLDRLKNIIASVRVYRSGYAFLITHRGVFVTHPVQSLQMKETIFSVARAARDPEWERIGREMLRGSRGAARVKDFTTGVPSVVAFAPLPSNGWSVGVIFPQAELSADVRKLTLMLVAISLAGFFLLAGAALWISRSFTRPLKLLSEKTREISKGRLEVELPVVKSDDEVGRLSRSFSEMRDNLREYIAHLAETTAAKERLESELRIASTIQRSFLPKRFPPFPERSEFEIYAALEPAREVGGDLYDYSICGPDQLLLIIGDVSGKGVPAALFMAVSKTLLKQAGDTGLSPAEIMRRVNAELCSENDESMFVTAFCAVLNWRTGELSYSGAGHNPPLLLRAGCKSEYLDVSPGAPLGAFATSDYAAQAIALRRGDALILYTDGVTEALDNSGELFGETRLAAEIDRCVPHTAQSAVESVFAAVKRFAGTAPQSDDIAVVSLFFRGPAQ